MYLGIWKSRKACSIHNTGLLCRLRSNGTKGILTFLPGWGISVHFIIFLFVPQVAGVYSHCCLDFLLGHLHSVIKDLEELLWFLVFRQPAEKGVLPWGKKKQNKTVDSTPCQAREKDSLKTRKLNGDPRQPQAFQMMKTRLWTKYHCIHSPSGVSCLSFLAWNPPKTTELGAAPLGRDSTSEDPHLSPLHNRQGNFRNSENGKWF